MKKIYLIILLLFVTKMSARGQFCDLYSCCSKHEILKTVQHSDGLFGYQAKRVVHDSDQYSMSFGYVYDSLEMKEHFEVGYVIVVKRNGEFEMIAAKEVTVTYWLVYREPNKPLKEPVKWEFKGLPSDIANNILAIYEIKPLYDAPFRLPMPNICNKTQVKLTNKIFY